MAMLDSSQQQQHQDGTEDVDKLIQDPAKWPELIQNVIRGDSEHEQNLCDSQEGQFTLACQDGRNDDSEGVGAEPIFLHDRSERCISLSSSKQRPQEEYLRFIWKGKTFQFTCLPFSLYKTAKTSDGSSPEAGSQDSDLLRQSLLDGFIHDSPN